MNDLITLRNDEAVTTSRKVAEAFGKRHDNVLRDIENLLSDLSDSGNDDFRKLNFEVSEYKVDGNNKTYHEYILTRDGFTMLVMKYSGDRAMKFKITYINAFNKMNDYINNEVNRKIFLDDTKHRLEVLKCLCRLHKKDKRLYELGINIVENMIPDTLHNAYFKGNDNNVN